VFLTLTDRDATPVDAGFFGR